MLIQSEPSIIIQENDTDLMVIKNHKNHLYSILMSLAKFVEFSTNIKKDPTYPNFNRCFDIGIDITTPQEKDTIEHLNRISRIIRLQIKLVQSPQAVGTIQDPTASRKTTKSIKIKDLDIGKMPSVFDITIRLQDTKLLSYKPDTSDNIIFAVDYLLHKLSIVEVYSNKLITVDILRFGQWVTLLNDYINTISSKVNTTENITNIDDNEWYYKALKIVSKEVEKANNMQKIVILCDWHGCDYSEDIPCGVDLTNRNDVSKIEEIYKQHQKASKLIKFGFNKYCQVHYLLAVENSYKKLFQELNVCLKDLDNVSETSRRVNNLSTEAVYLNLHKIYMDIVPTLSITKELLETLLRGNRPDEVVATTMDKIDKIGKIKDKDKDKKNNKIK